MNNRDPERGEPALDDLLRALAQDDARVTAPERLSARVMGQWDSAPQLADRSGTANRLRKAPASLAEAQSAKAEAVPSVHQTTVSRGAWLGRVAALAAAAVLVVAWMIARGTSNPSPIARTTMPLSAATNLVTGPPLETESLQLVRVRMPRGALRAFGFALVDPDAAAEVEVDMIVGEDGFPRSIRRVQAIAAVRQ